MTKTKAIKRSTGVKANLTLYMPETMLTELKKQADQDSRSISNFTIRLIEIGLKQYKKS